MALHVFVTRMIDHDPVMHFPESGSDVDAQLCFQGFRDPSAISLYTLVQQYQEREMIANSLQSAWLFLISDENKYQDGHENSVGGRDPDLPDFK
jgi:hypothetical protein